MTAKYLPTKPTYWEQQAHQCLARGDYAQAANFYEEAIEEEPDIKSYYWHLGLILLL